MQKKVRQGKIDKTLEEVAAADIMIAFFAAQQAAAEDKKEGGKFGMQADKIKLERELNIKFLRWLESN